MPRELTEREITRAVCVRIMAAWNFDYYRQREWVIYGARYQPCQTCSSPPYNPCLNMVDIKKGREPRINKQPHDERIDWDRILDGLKLRGYYKETIEQHVRREVARR